MSVIHEELRALFSDQAHADGWIKRQNDRYDGQTALDVLMSGELSDLRLLLSLIRADTAPSSFANVSSHGWRWLLLNVR